MFVSPASPANKLAKLAKTGEDVSKEAKEDVCKLEFTLDALASDDPFKPEVLVKFYLVLLVFMCLLCNIFCRKNFLMTWKGL